MDEELKKRNTDCVYFLASPLTCKKGIECEYRHSETVRLNPRDCWYWLAGSCLNPSCAFRHPPLDVHSAVSSEPAPPQNQSSAPVNKLKVPCYYYFNGFCNKGDRCSFLHGPDEDGPPAWKSSKTASAVIGAPPFENKTSAVSDAGSAPIETLPNPSEAASQRAAELQINSKPDLYPSAHNNVKDPSVYPHMSASEGEEAAAIRIDTLHPGRDLIQGRSLVCTDQSSEEELVDGELEREDWLESSPGFDVLVDDDRSENNLGYEEDPEYLIAIDRDGRELNGHFAGYDYEDPVEDDPIYPDARMFYGQERCDSFDLFDNGERIEYIRKVHERSRVKMLDPILPRKRKFLPVTFVTDDPRRMDLRNHLKKRRVIDGRLVTRFSRRNNSSLLVDRRRERPRKLGTPRLLGRLNSEVHNNRVGSLSRNGNLVHPNRPRQRYVEKRQSKQNFLSSQVSPKPVSRKRSSTEEPSTVFSGPKTLAQIKEEKRKFTENGDSSGRPGNSSRTTAEEFQGPKPLSEILKGRKKLGSVINVNNDSS